MRIFNILSALVNRTNKYLVSTSAVTSPATVGQFEVTRLNIQEPGIYLILSFVDLQEPSSEWPVFLMNTFLTNAVPLSNSLATRGITDGGGGLTNYMLINANAGDYVVLNSYNTSAGKTPKARGHLCAIKLVGGGN